MKACARRYSTSQARRRDELASRPPRNHPRPDIIFHLDRIHGIFHPDHQVIPSPEVSMLYVNCWAICRNLGGVPFDHQMASLKKIPISSIASRPRLWQFLQDLLATAPAGRRALPTTSNFTYSRRRGEGRGIAMLSVCLRCLCHLSFVAMVYVLSMRRFGG